MRTTVMTTIIAVLLIGGHFVPVEGKTAAQKNRRNQSLDREVKARRAECELELRDDEPCNASMIELENCILRCISHACYANVYGDDALEEGEVDIVRGRTYRSCARNELRNTRIAAVEKMQAGGVRQ